MDINKINVIRENKPKTQIEKIEFDWTIEELGQASPADEVCFMTEEGGKAYCEEKPVDCVYATFYFKDNGADFEQKYVSFNGFAEIFNHKLGSFVFEFLPSMCFLETADEAGRYRVTVCMIARETPDDDDENEDIELMTRILSEDSVFQFRKVHISNQFVMEEIGSIEGSITGGVSLDATKERIVYELIGSDK